MFQIFNRWKGDVISFNCAEITHSFAPETRKISTIKKKTIAVRMTLFLLTDLSKVLSVNLWTLSSIYKPIVDHDSKR